MPVANGVLSGSNSPSDDLHPFTPGTGATLSLAGGTTYWLVLSAPGSPTGGNNFHGPSLATSAAQTGNSGWSIGDRIYVKRDDDAFAETTSSRDFVTLSFAVIADAGAGRPTDVRASATTGPEITVEWQAPLSGVDPTGYEVCVIEAMMELNDANCIGDAVASTYTVAADGSFAHTRTTGLTAGTDYAIGVRAISDDGNSDWTAASVGGGAQIATDSGAAIARAITSITNNAIANRISQARDGGGDFNLANPSLAQTASRILAAQQASGDFGDGVKAILDGKVFALSSANGGGATPSFWASVDYLDDIGSDEAANNWDGDVLSIQLGADARMANGNLIGAAISHSESDIDYTDDGAKGEQKFTLTALHPYIGWHATNVDADLWASLAYGTGDLEHKVGDDTTTNDAILIGGIFGAAVAIGDNARLLAKIETARLTLDNTAEDGGDLDVDAHRARFGAEWSHTTRRGDATLRRGLTGGARYDGGDGITGVAAEVGANIGYDNGNGTAITARLWTLAAHDADYDEWGGGILVRHARGVDGQGFALRIEPSWGATQSRADELLNGDDALTSRAFDSNARMDTEIAYGIAYNAGMMTPYSGFRFADGGRDYRIGARYKLRPIPLEMDLEAYRKQRVDIENGVLLKASIRW